MVTANSKKNTKYIGLYSNGKTYWADPSFPTFRGYLVYFSHLVTFEYPQAGISVSSKHDS
jgi:hypothetical protein